jgi:hypothetical protein
MRSEVLCAAALGPLLVVACAPEPTWWRDPCGRGDPVDRTCDSGVETVEVGDDPTCADEGIAAGDPCTEIDATCMELRPIACADDPETIIGSDQVMTCARQEPEALCPESSRSVKTDIVYLDAAGRDALAAQVIGLPIASYAYVDPAKNGGGPQLGYILEDAPDAVFSGDGRVNLYAYTTAVLAAVQQQQEEIDRLEVRVRELEARAR